MIPVKSFAALCLGTALCCVAGTTQAAVVTFESSGVAPGGIQNVATTSPYQEAGFVFTPSTDDVAIFSATSAEGLAGNGTDVFVFSEVATITLTHEDGLFDLETLDIGRSNRADTSSITLTITGFENGGGVSVATFAGVTDIATLSMPLNWTDLTRVEFTTSDDALLDNLNVTSQVTAVPEPSSIALLGAIGLMAVRRRRRSVSRHR